LLLKNKVFEDAFISRKQLVFLFALKSVGIIFYILVFAVDSSKNLFNSDTQSIMHDANIIYGALKQNPVDYFRILFGLHSDAQYHGYFSLMDKWTIVGNNDFLLNDSRGVTRMNAFVMLFTFGKYEAQAMFMVFLSFIGECLMYKSFKDYFKGKEFSLLLILFFIPSVYFWTSGVLKEAIVVFLLGAFIYSTFKLFLKKERKTKYVLLFIFSVFLFVFIKPYVFLIVVFPVLIFIVVQRKSLPRAGFIYTVVLTLVVSSGILITKFALKKDIVSIIVQRQNDFVSTGYGGIFFYKVEQYVRLDYADIEKIKLVDEKEKLYTIKPHVNYMYWQYPNFKDTIYVKDNKDTLTAYPLINITVPSNSAITKTRLSNSISSVVKMIPEALINTFCKPFFINDGNKFETFASIENVLLLLFFILAFFYSDFKSINWNLFFCLISIVFISYLLIGLTTTISGAIVRYKVPFLPFLWMIPLMFIREDILKKIPFLNKEIKKL
jgi:hypothetical protein